MKDYSRSSPIKILVISAALSFAVGCNGDDPGQAAGTIEVASKPKTRPDFKSIGKEAKAARKSKEKFDVRGKLKAQAEAEAEAPPEPK
jgi:hypothetical protein